MENNADMDENIEINMIEPPEFREEESEDRDTSVSASESSSASESPSAFHLELGDIIAIRAPSNADLHEHTFYVFYIDDQKMKLLDMSSKTIIPIGIQNYLEDESIVGVDLLYRNLLPGFARQNGLIPGVWVNAHFVHDSLPVPISGEITNLEEDMIEITTYPGYKTIYIDFAYCGLPEELGLEKIEIADRPVVLKNRSLLDLMSGDKDISREEVEEATAEYDMTSGEFIIHVPESVSNAKPESLNDLIETRIEPLEYPLLDDASLELLGEETMMVEVLESERRYGLDAQLSDLMGKLASRVPVEERTPAVLEKIRLIISRYKDLREQFSEFDATGQVVGAKMTDYMHKPSVDHILNTDMNLGWIVPVVYEPRELINFIHDKNPAKLFFDPKRDKIFVDSYGPYVPFEYTETVVQKSEEDLSDLLNLMEGAEEGGPPRRIDQLQRQIEDYLNHAYSPEQNGYDAKMKYMDVATGHTRVDPVKERPVVFSEEVKLPLHVLLDSSEKGIIESAVSVINTAKKNNEMRRDARRFVSKMYLPGQTRLVQSISGKNRRKMYVREPVTDAEKVHVRSFLTMPKAFFTFQYVNSPSASIDLKTRLARNPPMLYRALKPKTRVKRIEVNDLDAEVEYFDYTTNADTNATKPDANPKSKPVPFLKRVTQYTLDQNAIQPNMTPAEVARSTLNAVIPRTRTLMKWMEPDLSNIYSYNAFVRQLEPFGIYEYNITFRQYMEARYFIKQQIREFQKRVGEYKTDYRAYRTNKELFSNDEVSNRVMDVIKFDGFAFVTTKQAYQLSDGEHGSSIREMFPSEYVARMANMDGADIFAKLIQNRMLKLVSPNDVIDRLEKADIDSSDGNRIRTDQCNYRYIVKKYESEAELQKDNGVDEPIYYDKAYDDTPYDILQKYKKDKARFSEPREFSEFLEDKLIREHNCPAALAPELAATLIVGKKEVREGEYAVLVVTPKLVANDAELLSLSERDKRDIVAEATVRSVTTYFKRVKNQWVKDTSVDETSFIDNNTLFCNLASKCVKQDATGLCLPNVSAAVQMKLATREKMMEEFDRRAAVTSDQMKEELQEQIMTRFEMVSKFALIRESKQSRQNDYSYELGKYVKNADAAMPVSPYYGLWQKIIGQPDFVKMQNDIYTFVQKFTWRAESAEHDHWLYCNETDTKLVPLSTYLLARAFRRGNYGETLDKLCRELGELSDDGDSVVDKYTGSVLKKIEYSTDEGYDESGYKIRTNAEVKDTEADIASLVQRALNASQPSTGPGAKTKEGVSKRRVFNDPTMQMAYNVYYMLSKSVGVQDEVIVEKEIEEFVLRTTMECMNDSKIVFLTEEEYVNKMRKRQKKDAKQDDNVNAAATFAPFEVYRNQTLIVLVASSLHISIQTLIPGFYTKTRFSGCVQSFDGYPLDPNSENAIGIKYMACVLNGVKRGSQQPWKSVESIGVDSMVKRMRMVIGEYLVKRADVDALLRAKREYLVANPEDVFVPAEVSLGRWTQFQPPLVPVDLRRPPSGITSEFEKDFMDAARKGSVDQHKALRVMEGKLVHFAYGIFDAIQRIVEKKRAVLTTAGGRAFLENTCCNEPGAEAKPLVYFMNQDETIEIMMKKAARIALILNKCRQWNKAPLFYAPESSRISYPPLPDNIIETTIFSAFISYCKFDSDEPIPKYLEPVCMEKPKYDRKSGLKEKIAYMKKHNKAYGLDEFYHLMRLVNSKNRVIPTAGQLIEQEPIHSIAAFEDILAYFDVDKPSPVMERNLVTLIVRATKRFDGKTVFDAPDANETKLKSYLNRVNREMRAKIETFITSNSVVYAQSDLRCVKELLAQPCEWNHIKSLKEAGQNVANSINRIGKVYPATIMGDFTSHAAVPYLYKIWGFSPEHLEHLRRNHADFQKRYLFPAVCDQSDPDYDAFVQIVRQTMRDVRDLSLFVEHIPVFSPIGNSYFLFDDQTTRMLYEYAWYSAVYQYIVVSMDPEFNQFRPVVRKRTEEEEREMAEIFGEDYDDDDDNMSVRSGHRMAVSEVQITQTENLDLRHKIAKMLMGFLSGDCNIKSTVNMEYREIIEKTERLKYSEKKRITDYLAKMTTDQRRVEMNLKKNKLGRWDTGLKTSLFKYDKNTWKKEQMEIQTDMLAEGEVEDGRDVNEIVYDLSAAAKAVMSSEDIETMEELDARMESEQEANDISGLGENYMDGAYYEEDMEREEEW